MRFENVRIAAFAHVLPERIVTSDEIEARLAPIYARLRLLPGRLELMSGIRERRFWEPGTRPSTVAARAGAVAIEKSGVDRRKIGCLIHASVSRDFLEPSSASIVHDRLELAPDCFVFDLSNACVGFANAMSIAGSMIERREIEAALVVAGEDGGPLVEQTIRSLLADPEAGRAELKRAYASLTIGSGAAAAVLASSTIARGARRLVGGAVLAATEHHELCRGDHVDGGGLRMETDSEALLQAGNALAARTWTRFLAEVGWSAGEVDRIVTHQVGAAHRRLLLETLALDPARDFPTVDRLGNVGSVSLPLGFSSAVEQGFIRDGDKVAMLGIGSGLHCMMLGVE